MMRTGAALLLGAALLVAGCAQSAAGPATPALDLHGEWELAEGTAGGAPLPQPDAAMATLTFEDGELGGTSFCNHYHGTYRLSGDDLRIDGLGGTEMGCTPDVMAAESAYTAALAAVDSASLEDGVLLLTGSDVSLRFSRVPPVPTSDLVGTRWVLESLVDGDSVSSTTGEPAALVLVAGGSLSGSTGCRTLSGRWALPDETLVLPELRAEGACTDDARRQDAHVLTVLEDEVRATVDGDRLTLTGTGSLGLVYRAG
jgi:heat shock protein HslJ